jgi:hypothetical protein
VAVVRQELIIALIDAHFAKEFCGLLANWRRLALDLVRILTMS